MDNRATILVVEDNARLLAANARVLEEAGYAVRTAATLAEARAHLQTGAPDAVVLDILLPDGNGLDFLPELRRITGVPVLLVTSLGEKDDRLAGLAAGGDDYIAKPYDLDELAARVAAFLRREAMHRANPAHIITKGPLRLDTLANRATLRGEDLLLTQKECALLIALARSEGRTWDKETLYETVWRQPMTGDDRTLKKHLSSIRGKLAGSGYTIAVSRGEGYRFERTHA